MLYAKKAWPDHAPPPVFNFQPDESQKSIARPLAGRAKINKAREWGEYPEGNSDELEAENSSCHQLVKNNSQVGRLV